MATEESEKRRSTLLEKLLIHAQQQHTMIEFQEEVFGVGGDVSAVSDVFVEVVVGRHVRHRSLGEGQVLNVRTNPAFEAEVHFPGIDVQLGEEECRSELLVYRFESDLYNCAQCLYFVRVQIYLEASRELTFLRKHMPLVRIEAVNKLAYVS